VITSRALERKGGGQREGRRIERKAVEDREVEGRGRREVRRRGKTHGTAVVRSSAWMAARCEI
jgi:hypothetical protein